MKRVHLISTPRNLSTAFMYSWAQRQDTQVFDEPFYAYYLNLTGLDHPGRKETMEALPHTVEEVKENILFAEYNKPMVFFKDMAQHLIDMNLDFLNELENIIYIRNPKQVIASFAQVIPDVQLSDVGIKRTFEIYQEIKDNCIVLDSSQLLENPESIWRQLCSYLNIEFDPSVLKWEAGARPEDGTWAPYWYKNVHQSTGFEKQKTSERVLPNHLEALNEEAQQYYQPLFEKSIKA